MTLRGCFAPSGLGDFSEKGTVKLDHSMRGQPGDEAKGMTSALIVIMAPACLGL